jgi:hypothetical protein
VVESRSNLDDPMVEVFVGTRRRPPQTFQQLVALKEQASIKEHEPALKIAARARASTRRQET